MEYCVIIGGVVTPVSALPGDKSPFRKWYDWMRANLKAREVAEDRDEDGKGVLTIFTGATGGYFGR